MSVSGLVERTVDIDKGITIEPLGRLFATNDAEAHTFKINLMASGKPVPLDGAGVVAYFMRAVGESTVAVKGSASGNVVTVTLPESCYAVTSRFQIVIKVSQEAGNVRTTVYAGHGWVTRVSTDRIIDPGHEIPSLDELLAKLSEIENAVKAAQTATNSANTAAGNANTATTQANAARDAANTAAGKANTATTEANAARDAAKEATDRANTAAERTEKAVSDAESAANAANTAAERVETAVSNAEAATEAANQATEDATVATEQANEATKNANTATEAANKAANKINNLTVSAHDISPYEESTAEITDDGEKYHIEFGLREGKQGRSFTVLGDAHPTLEDLETDVHDPQIGDQYNVGAEPPYEIYRWTGTKWEDQGSIGVNVNEIVKSVNGNLPDRETGNVELSYEDVNAVPTTRTVNGKELSSDITLTAKDVNALYLDEGEAEPGAPNPIDADTLNGQTAENMIAAIAAQVKAGLFDAVYPVGSVYVSERDASPETLFGGTWEKIEGKFIFAADDAHAAGTFGGAASVTSGGSSAANTGGTAITVEQMPPHNHNIYTEFGTNTAPVNPMTDMYMQIAGVSAGSRTLKSNVITNAGSGQAHTHPMAHTHTVATMPPYLALHMWKRTA